LFVGPRSCIGGISGRAELYSCRWQVELFFKWIKQHLHIKAFFGTSENAVKAKRHRIIFIGHHLHGTYRK